MRGRQRRCCRAGSTLARAPTAAPGRPQPGPARAVDPGRRRLRGVSGADAARGDRRRRTRPAGSRDVSLGAGRRRRRARAGAARRSARSSSPGLPDGDPGDAALDELIAQRRADELLIVMQTPPPSTGAAAAADRRSLGLGGAGDSSRSATTHLDGIVAGIDIAADDPGLARPAGARRRQGPADRRVDPGARRRPR